MLNVVKKILTRSYPYNRYGWDDWYYTNVRQIYNFWKFTRKAKKNIFYIWDGGSIEEYLFEWLKQHVDECNRYIPAEYWAEYQVSDFRKDPAGYHLTMDQVDSLYQDRLVPYQFVEKCYKYIVEYRQANEDLMWQHREIFSERPAFAESEKTLDGEKCYELKGTRDVTYLDFVWDFDSFGKLNISTSAMIVSDKEWVNKFSDLQQAIKDKDTEFLNGIIKYREHLWD